MVARSKARQIKAKRSLAWQIFSHVRFVIVASVHDILVRISFKEIFLTGFVDHSCLRFFRFLAPFGLPLGGNFVIFFRFFEQVKKSMIFERT